MNDRKLFRQSEIKTFLMCGKRWEFEYALGIKRPSNPTATVGAVVDTGVSKNLAQKVTSGVDLSLDAVLSIGSDDFDKRKAETEWAPDDDLGQAKDHAVNILRLHHTVLAPKMKPVTVQEKFHIETDGGFDLSGTIDYTLAGGIIGDTKTTSRARASSFVVERAFQPAMYDYAFRALHPDKTPAAFRFDIFTRPTKTLAAEYKPIEGKVTISDHEWLFASIDQVNKAINAGVALPAPEGSWHCSDKWCPYWAMCKGKR